MDMPTTGRRCNIALSALFLIIATCFFSCQGDLPNVLDSRQFTKAKLEKLGSLIRPGVMEQCVILPKESPYDTSVYWYVQTLYNQATGTIHRDLQSAPSNRWDMNRLWEVHIIDDSSLQHAFVLPGGDLFITTGMLRSFKEEYELYYLLTFEALLMHRGHLLDRLILEYNSLTLNNIIEENSGANNITATILANELPFLVFEQKIVRETDKEVLSSVCHTSLMEPAGIVPYLDSPHSEGSRWLQTRPSYDNRAGSLTTSSESMWSCGRQKGIGNYRRYVLNALQ